MIGHESQCTCKCHVSSNTCCETCKLRTKFESVPQESLGEWLEKNFNKINERLEALEAKSSHNEALVATIAANFVTTKTMELLVETNVNNIWKEIDDNIKKQIETLQENYSGLFHDTAHLEKRLNEVHEIVAKTNGQSAHKDLVAHHYLELNKHIDELSERIDEFQKWREVAIEKNIQDVQRMRNLETFMGNTIKRMDEVNKLMQGATMAINDIRKIPHECPICKGQGYIGEPRFRNAIEDLYENGVKIPKGSGVWVKDMCDVCEGKKIVWG